MMEFISIRPCPLYHRPEVMMLVRMGAIVYGWILPENEICFGVYCAWFDNPDLFLCDRIDPDILGIARALGIA